MVNKAIEDIVKDIKLFKELSDEDRDILLSQAVIKEYDAGVSIFTQGDPADHLYFFVSGLVKHYAFIPDGQELYFKFIYNQGASIGIAVYIRQDKFLYTLDAIMKSRLLAIPVEAVTQLRDKYRFFDQLLLDEASQHFVDLSNILINLSVLTTSERLGCFLLSLLGEKQANAKKVRIKIPFEKQYIAAMLGMKPESLSRAFASLRKIGVTTDKDMVTIDDVRKLDKFACVKCSRLSMKNKETGRFCDTGVE